MAGLADLFGLGGGAFGDLSSVYGELLTPEQKQGLATRGLMAAAAALGQAAMPSRMPVPLGAALGQAAGAMASGQDEAAMNALRASLVGQQAQALKQTAAFQDAFLKDDAGLGRAIEAILGGGGGAPTAAPAVQPAQMIGAGSPPTATTPQIQAGDSLGGGLAAGGALTPSQQLIAKHESSFQPFVGTGGTDLTPYIEAGKVTANGFPDWPGIETPKGRSTAAGLFQITKTNWENYAPKVGVKDFSVESQKKVQQAMEADSGMAPWAPFNAKLAAALRGGALAPAGFAPSSGPLTAKDITTNFGGPKTQRLSDGTLVSEDDYPYPYTGSPQPAPARPVAQLAQATQAPAIPGSLAPGGGADIAKLQALLLALARRNAGAEVMGRGNPYNSMIGVLQGSPQMAGAKAAAEALARVGPAYMMPDANPTLQGQISGAKRGAEHPFDIDRAAVQAALDRATKAQEQRGAASLDMTTITAPDANGQLREIPVTREQAVRAAQGLGVPELGIPARAGQPPAAGGAPSLVPGGILGKPVGVGTIPESQQLTQTPEGGVVLKDIPGGPAARATEERERAQKQSTDIVTQDIDRALGMSGFFTTGPAGAVLQGVPGTPAYNLSTTLDSIKGNVGLDRLQQMRQASPTGGALGNVTERENSILQSVYGSLTQSQSREQFEFNLRRLHNVYLDIINGSPEKLETKVKEGKITAAQRDAALAKRYALPDVPAQPGRPTSPISPGGAPKILKYNPETGRLE